MTQVKLLEIAQAQPHLWPSNAGLLGSKTLVKTLEGVLLDKDSGYTTAALMPVDTTVVKVSLNVVLPSFIIKQRLSEETWRSRSIFSKAGPETVSYDDAECNQCRLYQ